MVHHESQLHLDESMSPKAFDFPLDATYLEYNGISSPFSAYTSYPYTHINDPLSADASMQPYSNALHLGLGELAIGQMDTSPYVSHRPFTPVDSVAPSLTHMSPHQHSGSELSLDDQPGLRSTTSSPDSIREATALPSSGRVRSSTASASGSRYNPIAPPIARSTRSGGNKKRTKTLDSEDEDEDGDFQPMPAVPADKREEVRKQRIESEQRRRDELREGYKRLKDALPPSNQKASKVALLDRAVSHIKYMEMSTKTLQQRLSAAERETAHLRQVNEALMLGTAEQRAAAVAASAVVQAQVQSSY